MKTSHRWTESIQEKLYFMNTMNSAPRPTPPGLHPASTHRSVSFFCAAPNAHSVELAGDFNHWHPFPMQRSLDGWWVARLELPHGHHQYRFLVDGAPTLDPQATGIVRDEQGGRASLIAVS